MGVLKGKIAVVTGAGRGIGREICLSFAKQGAKIVANDLGAARDGTGEGKVADAVVKEIQALGSEAVANYDSVTTVEGGKNIFQTCIEAFGGMDILVNNAGILRDRTLFNMEESDWDGVIDVHLKGHYNCSRPFVRYIRDSERLNCRIINMSSVNGLMTIPTILPYNVSKGGLDQLTRVMAVALADRGIRVNAIGPGSIMTDMLKQVMTDDEKRHAILSRTPMGRCGTIEEIAQIGRAYSGRTMPV